MSKWTDHGTIILDVYVLCVSVNTGEKQMLQKPHPPD